MSRELSALDLSEIRKIARKNIQESRELAQEARRMAKETQEAVERLRREAGLYTGKEPA